MDHLRETILGIGGDKLVPNPHRFDKLESIWGECGDIVRAQFGQKWRLRMRLNNTADPVRRFDQIDMRVRKESFQVPGTGQTADTRTNYCNIHHAIVLKLVY